MYFQKHCFDTMICYKIMIKNNWRSIIFFEIHIAHFCEWKCVFFILNEKAMVKEDYVPLKKKKKKNYEILDVGLFPAFENSWFSLLSGMN